MNTSPIAMRKNKAGPLPPQICPGHSWIFGEFRYENGHLQPIQRGIFNMTLIRYDDIDMIMIFIDMI
jgi:hypothetical protein